MLRSLGVSSTAVGAVLLLAACMPAKEVGYVEIKTVPASAERVLYLDATKLEPIRNGTAVLRQQVGTAKLQTENSGGHIAHLCDIVVRKNRITSVTVSVLERPPRCQCRNPDASGRSCVS